MIQNTAKVWNQESFLRSLHVLSYSRNSPHFIEPEGSLPHLQVPATCPYPEPQQSIPCSTPHFYKIHFNILPSKPESSKWSLSLGSHHQKYVCTSPVSHSCHMSRPSHSSRFDHPNNIWWDAHIQKLWRLKFVRGGGLILLCPHVNPWGDYNFEVAAWYLQNLCTPRARRSGCRGGGDNRSRPTDGGEWTVLVVAVTKVLMMMMLRDGSDEFPAPPTTQ